ncbi:EF-hand domain-containing protein [Rhodobium gokarnense]|uniref:EF-hand domain-containing protein n=1 Tax=Rhodobium gokarnense TaxID=364296 RepID=A0ABT3HGW1_9HYPH|nr:EF-hand domain-containing protein [Rhodobium gokarnense]MCW2309645.1 hypothetical protein [Rhodobium gokarnense]
MSIGAVSGSMPDFSAMKAMMEDARAERFAKDDADGSGGLSLEEFSDAHENRPQGPAEVAGGPSVEEMFAQLDTDGDGEVTEAELEEGAPKGPPPGPPPGEFSSETFSSLLSVQEESSSGSITDLLSSGNEASSEATEEDLLSELMESLIGTEETA